MLSDNNVCAADLLWDYLKDSELINAPFYRNHSLGSFVVDFYSDELQLIIEVDGGHQVSQMNYFIQKSRYFSLMDYRVIRVWDFDIYSRIEEVLSDIIQQVSQMGVSQKQ